MADDCVFCKIVSGAIPSQKVYEDDVAFAFLDIRPLALGHTLFVPKRHAVRFEDLDAESAARLWKAVHKLSPHILKAVNASASTIAVNNGRDAGQEVPHVHIHVVPRFPGDGGGPIHALHWKRPNVSADELGKLAEKVRRAVPMPGRSAPV
jgi:histidine triad (HIT) family protein